MTISLIPLLAAIAYVASLLLLWKGIFHRQSISKQRLAIISLCASLLHLASALIWIFSSGLSPDSSTNPTGPLVDFSLLSSGSLIFAVTSLIITLSSIRKPVHALLFIIQPIGLALLIGNLFTEPTKLTAISTGVSLHILFSILAYGVITIAAASALVLSYATYKLKHKQIDALGYLMPPVETIDKLLFEIILAGEILLTISIVSGFVFIDDFFAQQLTHKTFFSLISWIIFATLLAGHHFFGWRGARAMKMTITGFVMLLLAYVGSKFVLELILA